MFRLGQKLSWDQKYIAILVLDQKPIQTHLCLRPLVFYVTTPKPRIPPELAEEYQAGTEVIFDLYLLLVGISMP